LGFLQAGDRVAVGVSGGADSVALLHLLLELRGKVGIVLSVAHFNHKIRGRASDRDEQFVAKLAAKHGLPFHVGRADVVAKAKKNKANLEDTARRTRYTFFDQLVADGQATKIAVAHTADDQAETVLAHIFRGTGLAGLGGIHPVAGHVFRPLIRLRRAELRVYLRAKRQSWREDASNLDTTKTRARIRKKLIPLLERYFQRNVVEHLATLADLAREDEAWLTANTEARARSLVERADNSAKIGVSQLVHGQPLGIGEADSPSSRVKGSAMSKRLVRLIVEQLKPRAGQVNAQHVQSVLNLAEHGENGKRLSLPGGVEVRRERDWLIFRTKTSLSAKTPRGAKSRQAPREFAYNIDLPAGAAGGNVVQRVPCLGRVFRLSLIDWPAKRGETSAIRSVLDREALRHPVVLRSWRPGDRYCPAGHRNAHKLKRLLNRQHIARWDRDGWPVLTSGGVLAWARGFPVAAQFAASERTRVGILIAEEEIS
jgi:tRNA(Ile)-lysidine synthase